MEAPAALEALFRLPGLGVLAVDLGRAVERLDVPRAALDLRAEVIVERTRLARTAQEVITQLRVERVGERLRQTGASDHNNDKDVSKILRCVVLK